MGKSVTRRQGNGKRKNDAARVRKPLTDRGRTGTRRVWTQQNKRATNSRTACRGKVTP